MITAVSLSPAVDKVYSIQNFQVGELFRVKDVVKSAGGKGINVARVASLLGEKVCCTGFKAGYTGEWLEAELVKLGVAARFVPVEGESRTNSNIIDMATGRETEILEAGPIIPAQQQEIFLKMFREILEDTGVLVCSGGLPQGIPVYFYRTLLEEARAVGTKVLLDTSDEVLWEGIKGKPYLIKPNKNELERYMGRELPALKDVFEACRDINARGVEFVAASLGKEGALLVSKDQALYAEPPKVQVQNTIGSGDSLVAGIAAGLHRGWSVPDAFMLGMACSVANTQFKEIGYVTEELVDKFLKQIEITQYEQCF